MKPHHFHPEAAADYTDAAEYYARVNIELAARFYDEIEGLIRDIQNDPARFRQFAPPARRHISTVFPYAVIYMEQAEQILIIAIMHGKRKPGYWRQRLS